MTALHSPERIRHAVGVVGVEIDRRLRDEGVLPRTEADLWTELSCCVLSSQVPYSLAQAASARLHASEIFLDLNQTPDRLEAAIVDLLTESLDVEGDQRRYRFPNSRARQLAVTWDAVRRDGGGLIDLLEGFADHHAGRAWFVQHAPGLGPKQSSMFLRNIGATYELAVLDRHVMNYMAVVGLSEAAPAARSMSAYVREERVLSAHAQEFGLPVGLLDWAVWIVMRVAGSAPAKETLS